MVYKFLAIIILIIAIILAIKLWKKSECGSVIIGASESKTRQEDFANIRELDRLKLELDDIVGGLKNSTNRRCEKKKRSVLSIVEGTNDSDSILTERDLSGKVNHAERLSKVELSHIPYKNKLRKPADFDEFTELCYADNCKCPCRVKGECGKCQCYGCISMRSTGLAYQFTQKEKNLADYNYDENYKE